MCVCVYIYIYIYICTNYVYTTEPALQTVSLPSEPPGNPRKSRE